MWSRRSLLYITTLLGVLLGCRSARNEDFVGDWTIHSEPTASTRSVDRYSQAVLRFKSNGTFEAANVPASMVGVDMASRSTIEATGKWRVELERGETQLYLIFEDIRGVPSVPVPYGMPLHVSARFSTQRLYYYLGDPDENRTVEFRKVPGPLR